MHNPIHCMLVDDEPLAIELLAEYVEMSADLQLICTSTNPRAVKDMVQKEKIELLFLDVQMPGMNGIEVIKEIDGACDIILTTAFPEYAFDGFELDVVDYLLKPISFDRFQRAVQKVVNARRTVVAVQQAGLQEEENDFFFVKTDHKMQRIDFNDILYIEGLKDYVSIYTTMGRVISLQVLRRMQEFLPSDRFVRVHRSYIVPLEKIDHVGKGRIRIGEQEIPIGDTYRDSFSKSIQQHHS